MYLPFEQIIQKLDFPVMGVIHVGGHIGEEIPAYKKFTSNIHIFEPQKECFDAIPNDVKKYNVALGDREEMATMNVADNKQSSSLLKPKIHLSEHPTVLFTEIIQVPVKTLDSFNISDCNFLNMDVQGYELNVLKGAEKTLKTIDMIYTEINTDEVYEGNPLLSEMDEWLAERGFARVWQYLTPHKWGDALYERI